MALQRPPRRPPGVDPSLARRVREQVDASNRAAIDSQHLLDLQMPAAAQGPRQQAFQHASRQTADHLAYLRKIAGSSRPLLIHGEPGSGRRSLAGILHELAGMRGPCIEIDSRSIDPDGVALFGSRSRPEADRLAAAANGLLVLIDPEVLPPTVQVRLDAMLVTGTYAREGLATPQPQRTRLISISTRDVEALVSEGLLRSLVLRMSPHRLRVASLRERPGDIAPIAIAALQSLARASGRPPPVLPAACLERWSAAPWPGNVPELLRAVTAFAEDGLPDPDAADAIPHFSGTLPTLRDCVDALIAEAMRRSGGCQAKAARLLGITPQSLNERLMRRRRSVRSEP